MDFKLVDTDAVIFTRLLTLRGNLKINSRHVLRSPQEVAPTVGVLTCLDSQTNSSPLQPVLHSAAGGVFLKQQSDHVSSCFKAPGSSCSSSDLGEVWNPKRDTQGLAFQALLTTSGLGWAACQRLQ